MKLEIYNGDWGLGIGPNPQLKIKVNKKFRKYIIFK